MLTEKSVDPDATVEYRKYLGESEDLARAMSRTLFVLDRLADSSEPSGCTILAITPHIRLCQFRDPNEKVMSWFAARTRSKTAAFSHVRLVMICGFLSNAQVDTMRKVVLARLLAQGWIADEG